MMKCIRLPDKCPVKIKPPAENNEPCGMDDPQGW
jgi:hypothetical protein